MATTKNTKTNKVAKTREQREGLCSGARWTDTAGASRPVTGKELEAIMKRNPEFFGR